MIKVSKLTIKETTDVTSRLFVELSRILSFTMQSSKGRSKIVGVVQHIAKLQYFCAIHSNIPKMRAKYRALDQKRKLMSGKIAKTMSRNKKIFKFLKFIDEFNKIVNLVKNKKKFGPYLTKLMLMTRIGSFFYYILDNFLWAINTGMMSKIPSICLESVRDVIIFDFLTIRDKLC